MISTSLPNHTNQRLVEDPIDAAPFMPLLMPVLEKAADILSDPEARSVAERSLAQLKRLNEEVEEAQSRQQHIDHSRVYDLIKSKVSSLWCIFPLNFSSLLFGR